MATRILSVHHLAGTDDVLITGTIDGITEPAFDRGQPNDPVLHRDGTPFLRPPAQFIDRDGEIVPDPDEQLFPLLRTHGDPIRLPEDEWPLRVLTATGYLSAMVNHQPPENYVEVTAAMLDPNDPAEHPTLSAAQLSAMADGEGPSDLAGHPVTPGLHLMPGAEARAMTQEEQLAYCRAVLESAYLPQMPELRNLGISG